MFAVQPIDNGFAVPVRLPLVGFVCVLLSACGAGTISTKNYSDVDISAPRSYAWKGIGTFDAGVNGSQYSSIIDIVEQKFDRILDSMGYRCVSDNSAQFELSFHLQPQNALEVEKKYRKKAGGIFGSNESSSPGGVGNVLLPDIDPPLYGGQQRGTVELRVFSAGTEQVVRKGYATVIFPEDVENRKQLSHLDKTLTRLAKKVLR
jgi:hypothetical protein